MSTSRQWALALALLGIVGLVICVALFAGVYVAGESTSGRVVDLSYHGSGSDPTCFPTVAYTVDGAPQRGSVRVGSSPCAFRSGDAVTVYYWPRHPGDPSLLSFGTLLPLLFPLALCAVAAHLALRKPKLSEQVAGTAQVDAASAADGQLVKIRGIVELGSEPLSAPITGRECVASWARVAERRPGKPDRKVQDESCWSGFAVRTAEGEARIAASTAVKLAVDADARGECDHDRSAELAAFLERHGHPPDVSGTTAHHYVWYEGLFRAGEEIFVVGRAQRDAEDGSLEIVAPEGAHVVLEHVRRDERKRAAHAEPQS